MFHVSQDVTLLGGCFAGVTPVPTEAWLFNGTGPTDPTPVLNRLKDASQVVSTSNGRMSFALPPNSITAVTF